MSPERKNKIIGIIMIAIPVIVIVITSSVLSKKWWAGPLAAVGAILFIKYLFFAIDLALGIERPKNNVRKDKRSFRDIINFF